MSNKPQPDLLTLSIRKGDVKSYEMAYHKYYDPLCRYGLRFTNNRYLIEDVVQDAFLSIWKKRKKLKINISLQAYLYKIVYNKLMDSFEKQSKLQQACQKLYQETMNNITPFDTEDTEDNLINVERLRNCINKLPKRCKMVFVEAKIYGKKHKEISVKFNISIKTVEGHIRRGYKSLTLCTRYRQEITTNNTEAATLSD